MWVVCGLRDAALSVEVRTGASVAALHALAGGGVVACGCVRLPACRSRPSSSGMCRFFLRIGISYGLARRGQPGSFSARRDAEESDKRFLRRRAVPLLSALARRPQPNCRGNVISLSVRTDLRCNFTEFPRDRMPCRCKRRFLAVHQPFAGMMDGRPVARGGVGRDVGPPLVPPRRRVQAPVRLRQGRWGGATNRRSPECNSPVPSPGRWQRDRRIRPGCR